MPKILQPYHHSFVSHLLVRTLWCGKKYTSLRRKWPHETPLPGWITTLEWKNPASDAIRLTQMTKNNTLALERRSAWLVGVCRAIMPYESQVSAVSVFLPFVGKVVHRFPILRRRNRWPSHCKVVEKCGGLFYRYDIGTRFRMRTKTCCNVEVNRSYHSDNFLYCLCVIQWKLN